MVAGHLRGGSFLKEEWREIAGYTGYYQVSSLGRVRGVDRLVYGGGRGGVRLIRGQIRKLGLHRGAYYYVILRKKGGITNRSVSRLVALAFIPNPDNLPEVDHINEVKTDNRVENLQWLSSQQNIERSLAKHFIFRNPDGELVKIFNLNKHCQNHNLDPGSMHRVNSGRTRSCKGWTAA